MEALQIEKRIIRQDCPVCAFRRTDVMAIVERMSATVAPLDRSLTGFDRFCRTGPIATHDAELCCTALYVLLPVLRSGNTKTVAFPATSEAPLIFSLATAGSMAASY